MAITLNPLTPESAGFAVNGYTADASGCEELVAAPGPGKSLHLRSVTITSGAALSITFGTGENAGAVKNAVLGPVTFAANQSIKWVFNPAVRLTANESLTVDASGAGAVNVFAQGFVK